ncbi:MAG: pentapeptide repeat-containing protein [Sphingobacteriia bacterium]|nr:pentapeptide repeat-containing protein [Sphingobacteriia bacterium]
MSRVRYNLYHTDVDLITVKANDVVLNQEKPSFLREIVLGTYKQNASLREYYFHRNIAIDNAALEVDNYPYYVCFHGHNEYDFEGLDYNNVYTANFLATDLSNVLIFDTVFSQSNFDFCKFQNTIFINVKFGKNCTFYNTDFRGAIFINCNFQDVSSEAFKNTFISNRSKNLKKISANYNFDFDTTFKEESFHLEIMENFLSQVKNEYDLELTIPKEYQLSANPNKLITSNTENNEQILPLDNTKHNNSSKEYKKLAFLVLAISSICLSLTYYSALQSVLIGIITSTSLKFIYDLSSYLSDQIKYVLVKFKEELLTLKKEYFQIKEKICGKDIINVPDPSPSTTLYSAFSFDANDQKEQRALVEKEQSNQIERVL